MLILQCCLGEWLHMTPTYKCPYMYLNQLAVQCMSKIAYMHACIFSYCVVHENYTISYKYSYC